MNVICYVDGFNLYHADCHSDALKKAVHGHLWIGEDKLRNSLLPEQVGVVPGEDRSAANELALKNRRPLARASGHSSRSGGVNNLMLPVGWNPPSGTLSSLWNVAD